VLAHMLHLEALAIIFILELFYFGIKKKIRNKNGIQALAII
jgi:hypothetical protein